MRNISLTLAAAALALVSAGTGSSLAQGGSAERIDKVSNRGLAGHSYASLKGLTYSQCERRCLADTRCKALEHVRRVAIGANDSQCRLFSSFGAVHASQNSDVGYKRPGLASHKALPPAAK